MSVSVSGQCPPPLMGGVVLLTHSGTYNFVFQKGGSAPNVVIVPVREVCSNTRGYK